MYVTFEYVVCTGLILLFAMLLFTASVVFRMIFEGSGILGHAAYRSLEGTPQRVRCLAANAVDEAGTCVHTRHR